MKVVIAVLMKMMVISAQRPAFPQPPPLTGQLIHWLGNYVFVYNFKTVLLKGTSYTTQRRNPIFKLNF